MTKDTAAYGAAEQERADSLQATGRWRPAQGGSADAPVSVVGTLPEATGVDGGQPDRQEADIEANLERHTDLFDLTPAGFFTLDREGVISSANRCGASLLGVRRSRLIGQRFGDFVAPEGAAPLAAVLARATDGATHASCEVRLAVPDPPRYLRLEVAACSSGFSCPASECHVAAIDITENRLAREALARSEARYRRLFESAKDGILLLDADGRVTGANPSLCDLLGYDREELPGRNLWELGLFPDQEANDAVLEQLRQHGESRHQELPVTTRDGWDLYLDFVGNSYCEEGDLVIQCNIRDITSRKQAELALTRSEEQCRTIVSNINEYVYSVCFQNGEITSLYHSPKCFDITGYTPEEYYRDPLLWFTMIHDEDRELVNDFLKHLLSGNPHPPIRHRIRHKDGSERWLLNNCAVQRSEGPEGGQVARLDGFILDITDLKQAEENIFFLAHHDPLTRLPNRSTLYARIDQVISVAQKANLGLALLFLDIDNFKQINDSLGHDVGDRVLQSVARRLNDCTRTCDIVSRLGGDEFVIVLWDCGIEETTIVAEKIISTGFHAEGCNIGINTSIGISLYPDDGADYLTLLRNADLAMYHAKKGGGRGFHFFTHKLNELAHERFTIETDLRRAVERNEFVLHYQPKVNIVTGKFSGMEALIRWQHPTRGLIPPDSFIGVAEESGLLIPISKWLIRTVCHQIRSWRDQGIRGISTAINLSASFFQHGDFESTIETALGETGVPPECLELELTEATIMSDPQQVLGSMAAMKALGLQLSIDDFGIGYSSLSYLKKLPVDKLKIDQSFIRNIASDTDNMAVVRAVLNIGRSMQLKVIAEGVENASQLSWLQAEGGEEAQGYYFSRPLPAQRMTALLKQRASFFRPSPPLAQRSANWH